MKVYHPGVPRVPGAEAQGTPASIALFLESSADAKRYFSLLETCMPGQVQNLARGKDRSLPKRF